MSIGKKILIFLVVGIGVSGLVAAIAFLPSFSLGWICGTYEFPVISSGDGLSFAQVVEQDCGATDSFHSSVRLWRAKQSVAAKLIGKRDGLSTIFTVGHDPRLLHLEWKGVDTLLIHYPSDGHSPTEFRCASHWANVQIECIPYTPDYSKPVAEMPKPKGWF